MTGGQPASDWHILVGGDADHVTLRRHGNPLKMAPLPLSPLFLYPKPISLSLRRLERLKSETQESPNKAIIPGSGALRRRSQQSDSRVNTHYRNCISNTNINLALISKSTGILK